MQDRRAIDNMNFCEVKEYIDARFGEHKLRVGEDKTFLRVAERLEALTGNPDPWSDKNRIGFHRAPGL